MKTASALSARGQVVIPKAVRDRLGLRPGMRLEFFEERGRLVAVKSAERHPVDQVYGILKLGKSTDELMSELRGPGPRR